MLRKTLFEFCVDSIIEEMDRGWGRKSSKGSDTVDPEVSSNPLEHLPTAILEEVVRILRKKKLLEKYLRWIILPQLHTLDLSSGWVIKRSREEAEIKQMIEHLKCASVKCQMLKNLILAYSLPNGENLIGFLPTFKNLQALDVSHTSAGDNCMWAVGTHCKYLRSLDVRSCWEVTDFGIQGLCLDYIEKENDEDNQTAKAGDFERRDSCRPPRLSNSLQTLWLEGTQVTKKGIQEALQKLRSLKALEHKSTVKVLGEMHREDWANTEKRNKIPKYALTKISYCIKEKQISSDRIVKAVSQCNSITELDIAKTGDFSDFFTGRNEIDNGYRQFTFDGVMIPILNIIGNSLKDFSISLFDSFKLCTIIDCCPNLRKLKLRYCGYYSIDEIEKFSNVQERKTLGKLQELTLDSVQISPDDLFTLMSSSSLKSIELEKCKTFNDDILQQAYDLHMFPNLEYLKLTKCDSVTERGINLLLKERSQVKKIKIISRKGIAKEKLEVWQISLKNWELEYS
ncbi:hypothetical protein DAPPUDRAFT_307822 [Daphnia pulex]|uniref:F-box domain-containing protein n=1 Tax=Daphnia pulex TaxID=6669 RepID=E9G1I4_DAPPU|nr:hypothetical protein DAPPUDRAFT_307822 [Daphnia pulex]|eukprot:EFX86810.1 hypothetical protein DAPPUDRAFT_307822 [Daphnia pulex]